MHLYLDDSGTRNPDKNPPPAMGKMGNDWFGLGGVLVTQEDEALVRQRHAEFMAKWGLDPDLVFLHSWEIRNRTEHFTWLGKLSAEKRNEFFADLYHVINCEGLLGIACVIDRPGYSARYRERYGVESWSLCKTAFPIVVERAAKYAVANNCKLKVFVERTDQEVDSWIQGYYFHLKKNGMPFDGVNMGKYAPLSAPQLDDVLYDFRKKGKSSPIMQLADLYLFTMCVGGYDKTYRPYQELLRDGRLIDCHLSAEELPSLGIKYSCWELVKIKS